MLSLGSVDFKSPKKNKTWRNANVLFYHKYLPISYAIKEYHFFFIILDSLGCTFHVITIQFRAVPDLPHGPHGPGPMGLHKKKGLHNETKDEKNVCYRK